MKRSLFAMTAASLMTSQAFGAIIVQYDAASPNTYTVAPVITDASVAGDNLVAGAGLTSTNFSTFNFTGFDVASTSFADAVAANDAWTWGFDVTAPATTIDLTTLDIRVDRSGTGPDDFEVQVSVNGGAPISLLTYDFNDSGSGVNFLGVDLSAVPTLTTGDSVVFTLGAYNSETSAGSFDLENITFPGGNDGIVVSGNVVPEPGSLALIGLGGLLIARRRR